MPVSFRYRARGRLRLAAEGAAGWLPAGVARAVVRRRGSPRLGELAASSDVWATEAAVFVSSVAGVGVPASVCSESAERVAELLGRSVEIGHSVYPAFYNSEALTLKALYQFVRVCQPAVVVETGVANGLSTEIILQALRRNTSKGVLHSVDIKEDVGSLVSNKDFWRLHVTNGTARAFHAILKNVGPIDIFYHDSDHEYRPQMAELRGAISALSPGGVLLSDDVDWSYAFLDFCTTSGARPSFLVDSRKVLGAVRLY
jgi:predicted O-methyltransferase YrrM